MYREMLKLVIKFSIFSDDQILCMDVDCLIGLGNDINVGKKKVMHVEKVKQILIFHHFE